MGQCRSKQFKRSLTWTFVLLVGVPALFLGAETWMDRSNYQKVVLVADSPQANDTMLQGAEHWLTRYLLAPPFRHWLSKKFILQADAAQAQLMQIQNYRDTALWQRVEEAQVISVKVAAAQHYLQAYPNGAHANEALSLQNQLQLQQHQQANAKALQSLQTRVNSGQLDAETLEKLLTEVRELPPHLEAETPEQAQQRQSLEAKLSKQQAQLAYQQDWGAFFKTYQAYMQKGRFLDAANWLNERQTDSEDLQTLKAVFIEETPEKIAQQARQALQDKRLREAEDILQTYESFPLALQNPQGRKLIRDTQQAIFTKRDENQYEQLRKDSNLENAKDYLQNAPLKTMREEVQQYQEYLESIRPDAQLDLTLIVERIDWKDVSDNGNEISVNVNGKREALFSDIDVDPNTSSRLNKNIAIKTRADAKLNINVTVFDKNWGFSDEDNGQGRDVKSVADLASNPVYIMKLKREENSEHTANVIFRLKGYPQAPKLPAWRKPQ